MGFESLMCREREDLRFRADLFNVTAPPTDEP